MDILPKKIYTRPNFMRLKLTVFDPVVNSGFGNAEEYADLSDFVQWFVRHAGSIVSCWDLFCFVRIGYFFPNYLSDLLPEFRRVEGK